MKGLGKAISPAVIILLLSCSFVFAQSASTVSLAPGWNLISLPVQPSTASIASVLSGIKGAYEVVWAYPNQTWQVYDPNDTAGSTLTTMQAGIGYWIKMTSPKTLSVSGSAPPASIPLLEGWNLVGFEGSSCDAASSSVALISSSLSSSWSYLSQQWVVYGPNNAQNDNTLNRFCPANGYWMNMSQAGTWTFPLGDPLLQYQWYIQNTGTSAFSSTLPTAGNDMNVTGAWAAGYTGKGVKVAVVDSGLEIAHEDLAANVDEANCYNFVTRSNDPTRDPSDQGEDHGTQVAGIIAAVAFNGKGGRGVAYDARLRGYNFMEAQSDQNYGDALGGMTISSDNDVFNASFGNGTPTWEPMDQGVLDTNGNLRNLRGGLGAILVNSAGNNFQDYEDDSGDSNDTCQRARNLGVSCGDPMQDDRLGGDTPIIVGSLNANGKKSSYSNAGSAIWVSAPGGEYGLDFSYVSNTSWMRQDVIPTAYQPAIVTTSRSGCANFAYISDAPHGVNALDSMGKNPLAPDCQYTAIMNGTSSAAPNTSATIALMLEANPNLGWRDVKHILVKTARKVDSNHAGVTSTSIVPGAAITLDQGWVQNAAGYWFSNWYGFGGVDATAAATMAASYTSYLPALQSSSDYSSTPESDQFVPAMSARGLAFTAGVSESFSTVEQVILFPNIEVTQSISCNQIEVTSPSGTKSILLHYGNGFNQTSAQSVRVLSNAFYGEPVNGPWTFTYYNFCSGSTMLSESSPQTIIFVGH